MLAVSEVLKDNKNKLYVVSNIFKNWKRDTPTCNLYGESLIDFCFEKPTKFIAWLNHKSMKREKQRFASSQMSQLTLQAYES